MLVAGGDLLDARRRGRAAARAPAHARGRRRGAGAAGGGARRARRAHERAHRQPPPAGDRRHRPDERALHVRHDRPAEGLHALPPLRPAAWPRALIAALELRADDVLYCPFPLYHVDAAYLTVLPALVLGAHARRSARAFSVSRFWDEVDDFGATVFDFMGSTLTLLRSRRSAPGDARQSRPPRLGRADAGVPRGRSSAASASALVRAATGSTDGGMVALRVAATRHEPAGSCGRPHAALRRAHRRRRRGRGAGRRGRRDRCRATRAGR